MSPMFKAFSVIVILSVAFFLSACGYHYGVSEVLKGYQTITIPFIKNDEEGKMTSTLIKMITSSTGLKYKNGAADLELIVDLLEFEHDNIGYQYERRDNDQIRHSIIPNETRLTLVSQVTLIDGLTGEKIAGPVRIVATTDFDHEYQKTRNGVNVFSLGQLTDYDEAYDAAFTPLYRVLSQKIIDYIIAL